ncbi:hypothetical protein CALCODRAFT_88147 [Calocera cornea HHB12733]|uniref:Uncharacterized protein n=1 Tax=Calocera cornea HHB12733 TaxID=1353952 RepID=A0A165DCC1_9BASI|nr:hypothetical protein CALCODRAFT_88147 [Calocera cornea HHB12733]
MRRLGCPPSPRGGVLPFFAPNPRGKEAEAASRHKERVAHGRSPFAAPGGITHHRRCSKRALARARKHRRAAARSASRPLPLGLGIPVSLASLDHCTLLLAFHGEGARSDSSPCAGGSRRLAMTACTPAQHTRQKRAKTRSGLTSRPACTMTVQYRQLNVTHSTERSSLPFPPSAIRHPPSQLLQTLSHIIKLTSTLLLLLLLALLLLLLDEARSAANPNLIFDIPLT